ncbi:hypothetical protein [Mycolicibacter arupensis]|jgi:hypothetical protein|uniref:Uncharacterized protein n=1 Tax=Mycolicibacter arupensis TaxID=342002 RepID=A0A5C7XYB3_9MYCO|nr:hypothetical protein [Mycolicibacter arupensis]MCV7277068.1 hypothetical protein [Mycolicibacter arupensis]TXI54461.1 MAG: hypothetical protein E6Q54_14775 [Mycolicibacter arupensis]
MVRVLHLAQALVGFAAISVASPPTAIAAPQKVSGQIACINSASPVGVWIQAESSKSGWASKNVPIEMGGFSKVNFSYTLDKGGRYQVHVGCGGTAKNWGSNIKSGYVSGNRNFVCNDAKPWTIAAFKAVAGRVFGKADLTQGVPYGKCNVI